MLDIYILYSRIISRMNIAACTPEAKLVAVQGGPGAPGTPTAPASPGHGFKNPQLTVTNISYLHKICIYLLDLIGYI